MFRSFFAYFLCLFSYFSFSQSSSHFIWPIDSPRIITGNYGELRPNHFHDGLDFATNGQIGMQVYSAEEGYVSRIKISSTGYGKCVYITHPNGKVTVYGHLNSYSLKIDNVIRKEQYAQKKYEAEVFPKKGWISIRKNEIIGLSGNSGGSTGPHLHFEIRDEKSETPLNPLTIFKIRDNTPPTIQKIGFYDLTDTCSPKFIKATNLKSVGNLLVASDMVTLPQSIVGFAFSGFDRYYSNGNPNNIFHAELYLDDQLIYSHTLNKIDFSDNRYVNEFSEVRGGVKFQKCFLPTLYPQNMYANCNNKGRIILKDNNAHKLKLIVKDESGNEQAVECNVKAKDVISYKSKNVEDELFITCNKDFAIAKNELELRIPKGTLFYSVPLIIGNTIKANGKLILLPADVNLKQAATVGFKIPENLVRLKNKLILKNGSVSPPICRNDSVFFEIKNFGMFQLSKDTIGPKISTQLSSRQLRKAENISSFSFVIEDNGSGIKTYSLFLNNEWVIGEYDAKYNLVTYYFDEESPTGNLEFRIQAEDKCGNQSVLSCSIKR